MGYFSLSKILYTLKTYPKLHLFPLFIWIITLTDFSNIPWMIFFAHSLLFEGKVAGDFMNQGNILISTLLLKNIWSLHKIFKFSLRICNFIAIQISSPNSIPYSWLNLYSISSWFDPPNPAKFYHSQANLDQCNQWLRLFRRNQIQQEIQQKVLNYLYFTYSNELTLHRHLSLRFKQEVGVDFTVSDHWSPLMTLVDFLCSLLTHILKYIINFECL